MVISNLKLRLFIMFFSLFSIVSLSQERYKQDYQEACKIISTHYIYLEKKLGISREEFLQKQLAYANQINWMNGKYDLIREIRELCAQFPDGNFTWSLPDNLCDSLQYYSLGFVGTFDPYDSIVKVEKVYPSFKIPLEPGDIIRSWNGKPMMEVLKENNKKNPQSTPLSNFEINTRLLSFYYPSFPLIEKLEPVIMDVERKEKSKTHTLGWQKCDISLSHITAQKYYKSPKRIVLFTRDIKPSLEEIPEDAQFIHESLYYYFYYEGDKKIAVLHPRDFFFWSQHDINITLAEIKKGNPNILVIDLKDAASGDLSSVLFLSNAMGIHEPFRFFYDYTARDNGMRMTGVNDFNHIESGITINNVWEGPLLLRTNPVCGSGCDYFTHWVLLNKRATLIGLPPAGSAGGTDTFILPNTGIHLEIPSMERIIVGSDHSIESSELKPLIFHNGPLKEVVRKYLQQY